MKQDPLIAVVVLALVSLIVAFVVFKILRSTAIVKTAKYQAGGALAGFIIVFGLVGTMNYRMSVNLQKTEQLEQTIKELGDRLHGLEAYTAPTDIEGTVDPYSSDTKVVLSVTASDLPVNKKFRLSAPCVDISKRPYSLYVMRAGRHYSYDIYPNENISDLQIALPQ